MHTHFKNAAVRDDICYGNSTNWIKTRKDLKDGVIRDDGGRLQKYVG
jgi:hypothetical protein